MTINRKIGERFDYDGVTLEVVEVKNSFCTGCYFYNKKIECEERVVRNTIGCCGEYSRGDGKIVIFRKVE